MKIQKGNKIRVIYGKDKGREGVVERVYTKSEMILVPGINIAKKHVRKTEQQPQGGVVEVPRPLHLSKVMFICPKCNKPTRIGYKVDKDKKFKVCKKCKNIL